MSTSRAALAQEIVRVSQALHARGWVANHDGNVSVRLDEGRFMVTPTAISKADAQAAALAITDPSGKPVEGDSRPPSEFALHLGCYAERPDVQAIVHAHPPYATAMACAGKHIDTFMAEAVVSIGPKIPLARFSLPFGEQGAAPLRELIGEYDALLLTSHGVITVGPNLELALLRMELVEHLARISTLAKPHGGVQPLPASALAPLIAKRRKAGLGLAAERTSMPGEPAGPPVPVSGADASDGGPGSVSRSVPSTPLPDPGPSTSWKPAGPPPAKDAWSGGATEATCGLVYGSGTGSTVDKDLSKVVAEAVAKHLD